MQAVKGEVPTAQKANAMPDQLKTMNIFQNEGKSPEVKFKGLLGAQFGIQAGRIFWPFILKHSHIALSCFVINKLLSIFIKNTTTMATIIIITRTNITSSGPKWFVGWGLRSGARLARLHNSQAGRHHHQCQRLAGAHTTCSLELM